MKNELSGGYIHLFKCPNRYKFLRPLGKGAYGYVVSAFDTVENKTVAIKKITNLDSHLISTRTLREIRLLKHFRNTSSIVNLKTCFVSDQGYFNDVYLIIELMEADLHHIIYSHQCLTVDHVRYLSFQLMEGLKAIHAAGVIHRDLKPANCLVNKNCQLKICDFGLAREGCDDAIMTNYVQTRWYRAPELLFGEKIYDSKVDMWSAGCIMAELYLRKPLIAGRNSKEQIKLILDLRGRPTAEYIKTLTNKEMREQLILSARKEGIDFNELFSIADPESINLLELLFVYDKSERLSAADAISHSFFKMYSMKNTKSEKLRVYDDFVNDEMTSNEIKREILSEIVKFYNESTIEKTIKIEDQIKK